MAHKPPELLLPEGTAGGQGLFMAINYCGLSVISTLIGPLLLLVNTHGSFHCKQAMLLVNISLVPRPGTRLSKHVK